MQLSSQVKGPSLYLPSFPKPWACGKEDSIHTDSELRMKRTGNWASMENSLSASIRSAASRGSTQLLSAPGSPTAGRLLHSSLEAR